MKAHKLAPSRLLALPLALLFTQLGCGSATYYEPYSLEDHVRAEFDQPPRTSPAGPNWQDASAALIPPPISEGWPIRGGDPNSDEQRVACAEEMDISRAHVSKAIESAKALGAVHQLRCLSRKAAVLKTLRGFLDYPAFYAAAGADPRSTCLTAQTVVHEARSCR